MSEDLDELVLPYFDEVRGINIYYSTYQRCICMCVVSELPNIGIGGILPERFNNQTASECSANYKVGKSRSSKSRVAW